MSGFFNYFPSLFYSNTAVTNIIAKVRFDQSVSKNLAVFYPYTVEEGERPDQIAQHYYDDPSYDWIVYLSNNITDPYHEWPLTQSSFDSYIKEKYGSTANAQAQIAYYTVNYENDDSVISTAAYDALAGVQKQYWVPITGYSNTILNYERKALDQVVETNQIISLSGTFGTFTENDIIKQAGGVTGTVGFANSTNLVIKHISGTWQSGQTVFVGLSNTVANATITAVDTVYQPLSSEELSYWIPVYRYDVEFANNEQKKHIKLLSNIYLNKIEADMKDVLSQ
jgi:hypothetical protein